MKGSVESVSDIEWPSRKGRCHSDSNYAKYSREQSKTVLTILPYIPGDIPKGGLKNTTFRMTNQEDRSFDIIVTDLRRRAEYCDFGVHIVVGINDSRLSEQRPQEMD